MDEHDFGLRLREFRHARGETLEDVSAATGLSVAMLSRVERGERLPSPESVEALSQHFGLPADELMSQTIAHRMLNRYGRESSNKAALRMQSDDLTMGSTWPQDASADVRASGPPPRPSAPARSPVRTAGAAFSTRPIEDLFAEEAARDSLSDAARVAEVALESAVRAVKRAMASGDPAQVEEAQRVLERLKSALTDL
ncbi:MAG: helix-turn-helix transcriptional regulator [Coriobacteriia bacterium]|nr:helix-turn-helix transcriptional regulator [Coriobacteriia bacterium]